MSQFSVDDDGVESSGLLTMLNQGFTQEDLDANLTACMYSGNNAVNKGNMGDMLLGKVIAISKEKHPDTGMALYATVYARGVARFQYSTCGKPDIGRPVCLAGEGKVCRPGSTFIDGNILNWASSRGVVIAIDKECSTCDVWLG